jgi:hypothetical protein
VLGGHQRHVRQGPCRGPPGARHAGGRRARARRRPRSRRSPALPGIWPRPRRPGARARRRGPDR